MFYYPDLQIDTTAVCRRNALADVTFYDSANIITTIPPGNNKSFPFIFIENNRLREIEARASLIKQLKPGETLPDKPLDNDWIILIILLSVFLFSLIRSTSKNLLPEISRFFLFRGITDPVSRDIGGIFHWQSTIANLVSFMSIGLFAYCISETNNLALPAIKGLYLWLIYTGIVILAITLRHITCYLTGSISGKNTEFHEYLVGIYQSYRFGALLILIIVILMCYTSLFSAGVYVLAGIITLALMYVLRIIRLLLIFIKRNISIFYLILYLCALEILPVIIAVKYFTGLV